MLNTFGEGTPLALASTALTAAWLFILSTPVGLEIQPITLAVAGIVSGVIAHYFTDFTGGWAALSGLILGTVTLVFPFNDPVILRMTADLMATHFLFIFGAFFVSYIVLKVVWELNFGELEFEE